MNTLLNQLKEEAAGQIKGLNDEMDWGCLEASLQVNLATAAYLEAGGKIADELGVPIEVKTLEDYMECFSQVEEAAWLELLISEEKPFGWYGEKAEDVYKGTLKMLNQPSR